MVPLRDRDAMLALPPTNRASPGLDRHADGHSVQPGGQGLPGADGRSAADKGQEDGLEGVLGIGVVRQELTAHCPDERTMTAHQLLERSLIPVPAEPVEQVGIGGAGIRDADHGLQ
jgi:hypothetical protein